MARQWCNGQHGCLPSNRRGSIPLTHLRMRFILRYDRFYKNGHYVAGMTMKDDELVTELQKVISIKKADHSFERRIGQFQKDLALLTSEIAEGRAKTVSNKIRIATLDADKFDVMCKEMYTVNEENEKQIIELKLEIEAARDIKNIVSIYEETLEMLSSTRFGNNGNKDGMNDTRKDIESAQNELQMLSDEVQAFEENEKILNNNLSVTYADIPLAVKRQPRFEEAQRGISSQTYACTTQSKSSGFTTCDERLVNISYICFSIKTGELDMIYNALRWIGAFADGEI
ncbi:hypothetical protein DINM_001600 [Dirofilaria immitis]|nr:hypothetical protein [Dirofilaria immitis]